MSTAPGLIVAAKEIQRMLWAARRQRRNPAPDSKLLQRIDIFGLDCHLRALRRAYHQIWQQYRAVTPVYRCANCRRRMPDGYHSICVECAEQEQEEAFAEVYHGAVGPITLHEVRHVVDQQRQAVRPASKK